MATNDKATNDKKQFLIKLTLPEKIKFVDALYKARIETTKTWCDCFSIANNVLHKNRRIGKKIDHPNKMSWIKTMLEAKAKGADTMEKVFSTTRSAVRVTSKMPLSSHKHSSNFLLSPEKRENFAKAVYQSKQINDKWGWKKHFEEANKILPPDKHLGSHIDHPKQISWIIPLLEQLEKNNKKTSSPAATTKPKKQYGSTILTAEEKLLFAKTIYIFRKENPDAKWPQSFDAGRKALPADRQIGKTVSNPSHLSWILPMLEKLKKADKERPIIDHRGQIPPVMETVEKISSAGVQVIPEGESLRKNSLAKTYLKAEEKLFFAEIAYKLRITNAGLGWRQILIDANNEMPAHRRLSNTPASPSQIPWLPPLLDQVAKQQRESFISEQKAESEIVTEVIPEIAPEIAPAAPALNMEKLLAGMLANALQSGNIMQSPTFQKELMNALLPQTIQQVTKPSNDNVAVDYRPKVIVVGLLPVQTNEVQAEYGKVFNLRFFNSNVPSQQIKESAKHCTFAILMTKFTSHSTAAALRAHPGFIFCNGNSSALKQILQEKLTQLKNT